MTTSNQGSCFHCAEPVPAGTDYGVEIDGRKQLMCCPGCQAAARLILDSGWHDFYRFRTEPAQRPTALDTDEWSAYDRPVLRRRIVAINEAGEAETVLLIDGIRCAACAWLIDRAVSALEGLSELRISAATRRTYVRWDPQLLSLSAILRRIAVLGYRPVAVGQNDSAELRRNERNTALKRLAVAGLGMMQVMTFAVALYAGAFHGMDAAVREYLRIISLIVTTPVVLYSGQPFITGAWRDLRARAPGMDVPVSLAIVLAYAASTWNTFRGGGEVYFDSVVMFIFFLTVGRFVEMIARHRADDTADALARLLPATALRVRSEGTERIGTLELEPADEVLVRAGEAIPADGYIAHGETTVDEALLTGEPRAVNKTTGEPVIAGSVNVTAPVRMIVEKVGPDTTLSAIARLVERAQSERPRLAQLADHVARYFVSGVLVFTALLGVYLLYTDRDSLFTTTLAVLVVTCPCALSLATPTALAAAASALARHGMLVVGDHAIETMARITYLIFDKTGTLTRGRMTIVETRTARGHSSQEALGIAAALEHESTHPLATAFGHCVADQVARDVTIVPGSGIEGAVGVQRYRIGTPEYVDAIGGGNGLDVDSGGDGLHSWILLGDEKGRVAAFRIADEVRPATGDVVRDLEQLGLRIEIASGDQDLAVGALAERLGITRYKGRLRPADKLARIRELQDRGEVVAAVGDGINDAPVLGGADLSLAMGSGATLAQSSADMIVASDTLRPLGSGVRGARQAMRVVRQNFAWALAYNAAALPIAASGWLEPWMAAIGMSLSSLIVVTNSARLSRGGSAPGRESRVAALDPHAVQVRP